MKTLELRKATKPLASYARRAKKHPFIVTLGGKPLAAVVGVANADLETVSLSNNPKFIDLIVRSRSRRKQVGGIWPEEMRQRLGLSKRSGKTASHRS